MIIYSVTTALDEAIETRYKYESCDLDDEEQGI